MKRLSMDELHELELTAAIDFAAFCNENGIRYYLIAGCAIGSVRHGGFIPWDEDMDFAMMRSDYEKFLSLCDEKLDKKYFIQNHRTDKNCMVALSRFCIRNTYVETKSTQHIDFCKNIYFDIFPLDNVPNDERLRLRQKKKLLRINKLILRKIGYRLETRSKWKQAIHNFVAYALTPISFDRVIGYKEKIMTMYNQQNTKCVCSMASKYAYEKQTMPKEFYGNPTPIVFENTTFNAPEKLNEYLTQLYGDYMTLPPMEKRKAHHEGYYLLND